MPKGRTLRTLKSSTNQCKKHQFQSFSILCSVYLVWILSNQNHRQVKTHSITPSSKWAESVPLPFDPLAMNEHESKERKRDLNIERLCKCALLDCLWGLQKYLFIHRMILHAALDNLPTAITVIWLLFRKYCLWFHDEPLGPECAATSYHRVATICRPKTSRHRLAMGKPVELTPFFLWKWELKRLAEINSAPTWKMTWII